PALLEGVLEAQGKSTGQVHFVNTGFDQNLAGQNVELLKSLGDIGILLRGTLHYDRIAHRVSYDAQGLYGGRAGSLGARLAERSQAGLGFARARLESFFLKRRRPSAASHAFPAAT